MLAMWIGCPMPSRWLDASFSTFLLPASSRFTRSVNVTEGAMAFTRILWGAYSTAIDRVAVQEVGITAGIGGFGPCGGRRGLACPIVDVGDDNAGAFFGETLSRCPADAATAAGDERHFACQPCHSRFLLRRRNSVI